ncbi:Speckle-type POZ protein, partial [Araneus ventricosus]
MVIQRRTFNYQINDFSSLPNPWSISFIPDSVYDETPPLLLTLHSSDGFKNVIIYIRPLVKKIDESLLVKCIVKVLATKGSPVCIMNDSHLFSPSMPLVWKTSFKKFNFLVDQNLYLKNDHLTLQFELNLSNDIEISSIEHVSYTIPSASSRRKKTIMDDLLQFYEKQKYCDVKLQVGNETVQAHRAVLCSRSPVFQEMFETETTDNKKVISDADMTTFKHMLQFMYTENIENLNFENALKLYSVADKYQYEALRKQCSLILSSNIQSGNVCEILRLSSGCGDDELKTSSLNYIRLHANEVFALGEWKSFVLNNVLLASEA